MKVRPQLERRYPQTKKYQITPERIGRNRHLLRARDLGKELVPPLCEVDLSRKAGIVELKERPVIEAVHAIVRQWFGDRHDLATCRSGRQKITIRSPINEVGLKAEDTLDKPFRVGIS